jgi:hypothetical protein
MVAYKASWRVAGTAFMTPNLKPVFHILPALVSGLGCRAMFRKVKTGVSLGLPRASAGEAGANSTRRSAWPASAIFWAISPPIEWPKMIGFLPSSLARVTARAVISAT